MKEQQSYFEFIQSIYAHNFAMHDLMHEFFIGSKEDNIHFFLDFFTSIKGYNLDNDNKELLYFILNSTKHHDNHNQYFAYKQNHDVFSSSLWFLAYQESPKALIDVVSYFNEQINQYVKSNVFLEKASSELAQEITVAKGATKIKLLTQIKGLFLPYQAPKLYEWATKYEEKQQLEAMVMNNSQMTPYRAKIKV